MAASGRCDRHECELLLCLTRGGCSEWLPSCERLPHSQRVVVVACGGGGVPAVQADGVLKPVEAVVDKDLSSAVLARELGATRFIILTAVDEVMVDYGKDTARPLKTVSVDELRQYAKDGQFPPGSMGPKIESVFAFLDGNPGAEVLITSPETFGDALTGDRGTWIRA